MGVKCNRTLNVHCQPSHNVLIRCVNTEHCQLYHSVDVAISVTRCPLATCACFFLMCGSVVDHDRERSDVKNN